MKSLKSISILAIVVLAGTFSLSFTRNPKLPSVSPSPDNELIGAGSTFPFPLYSKMLSEYNKQTGAKITYQSVGSGSGIKQLTGKTVDFGATDAFLSDDEISKMPAAVVHVPTSLGAVVVVYNVPAVGGAILSLAPDVLADIYMGRITNWSDVRISKCNPGIKLPDQGITVVHRSDDSGTSFVFTDYLAKVSPDWNSKVGHNRTVAWPMGIGTKSSDAMCGTIKQLQGSIGYVELSYALTNHLEYALIKNKKGNYIKANVQSITAAKIDMPSTGRVSITNTDATNGYPISSYTWILLYKDQNYNGRTIGKATAVAKLAWWMTHEGQQYSNDLNYVPLPNDAKKVAETMLKSVVYNGKPLL